MTYKQYLSFYKLEDTAENGENWIYNEWQHGRVFFYKDDFFSVETGKKVALPHTGANEPKQFRKRYSLTITDKQYLTIRNALIAELNRTQDNDPETYAAVDSAIFALYKAKSTI